jgi:hypothetical protein
MALVESKDVFTVAITLERRAFCVAFSWLRLNPESVGASSSMVVGGRFGGRFGGRGEEGGELVVERARSRSADKSCGWIWTI